MAVQSAGNVGQLDHFDGWSGAEGYFRHFMRGIVEGMEAEELFC